MKSFIKFNQGLLRLPLPVRLWMMLLLSANLVAPLFFLDRPEAQIVLVALVASMVLMTILTGLTGFTRLLGAGHIFWIPLVVWLWSRLDQIPADDAFGVWARALIVLNTISLLIDVVDVVRYAAGDREETVQGLPVS